MKRVLNAIEAQANEFKKAPIFEFLRDENLAPSERLRFLPSMAHFVITFSDLCRLMLHEEPAKDFYQEIVNRHASEEGTHWRWFLADLGRMGFDPTMKLTDAMRYIWSDATIKTRMLSYHLCRLALGQDGLRKLTVIYAFEGTSSVSLGHLATVGKELSAKSGQVYQSFGDPHIHAESAHALWSEESRRKVAAVELAPAVVEELNGIVNQVFQHFRAFVDEMNAIGRAGGHLPG